MYSCSCFRVITLYTHHSLHLSCAKVKLFSKPSSTSPSTTTSSFLFLLLFLCVPYASSVLMLTYWDQVTKYMWCLKVCLDKFSQVIIRIIVMPLLFSNNYIIIITSSTLQCHISTYYNGYYLLTVFVVSSKYIVIIPTILYTIYVVCILS